mmetsp:Transcript_3313/g.6102  ORF Transcript_3313/g.6102 Transcript_3313/m.6102 type:complete len:89 (+) Transcript_3313:262-528(+)
MSPGKGSMYGCVFFGSPSSPPRDKSDAVGCMHREENHSRLMTEMNNMSQEPETVKMTLEILKKARFPKVDLTRHHSSSKASRKRRIQE